MHLLSSRFFSFLVCITAAAGDVNLLTYVDGGIGNILGTYFGTAGTNATYDYVIVGGGNAGLTIATRLAEDPSISVAVIELEASMRPTMATAVWFLAMQITIRDPIQEIISR